MRILVCAATAAEAAACSNGIAGTKVADRFEVLKTGVGLARAEAALSKRLAKGPTPELIISSGFAGSLDSELPVGAWAIGSRVLIIDPDEPRMVRAVGVTNLKSSLPGVSSCSVISAEALTHQKQVSRATFGHVPTPIMVDMESAALAEVAESHRIPFMVLRLITDSPDDPLPAFVSPMASAMAAKQFGKRIRFSASGLKGAVMDPKGIVHMVKNGSKWALLLKKYWAGQASAVAGKVD